MKLIQMQQVFFLGLLIITTGVFVWMLGSYIQPVLWATIIALVFYPMYQWVLRRTKERATLASLLTILIILISVIGPLALLGGLIAQDSLALYQRISEESGPSGTSLLQQAESVLAYLEPYGITQADVIERVREWTATISQAISSSLLSIGQVTFKFFVQITVMVYLLFFFFRDGPKIVNTLQNHVPLERSYEDRLLTRFTETTRAIIKGTFTVAVLQGAIIAFTFWLTGITSPVLWGVAVAILALIPAVGAALVWIPAGLILLFTGPVWGGITILVVGAILMTLVDEFLRPILVGRSAKMPDAIILLATLGGLSTFGISGFLIGPVIAALFLTLWVIFAERFNNEEGFTS